MLGFEQILLNLLPQILLNSLLIYVQLAQIIHSTQNRNFHNYLLDTQSELFWNFLNKIWQYYKCR